MRISSNQLAGKLATGLPSVSLLYGDEPLLIEESCDVVRRAARDHGYQERIRMTVELGFDWCQLSEQSRSLSLFSNRKLLELRMPSGRPGEPGAKAVVEYCAQPQPDVALVIIAGRLESRAKQSRWVKAIDKSGLVVGHDAIGANRLSEWVRGRLKLRGLSADSETVQLLSYYLEGNLSAAAQEIDELALLCPDGKVSAEQVQSGIADHARFNVYTLVDVCLGGNASKALRVLESLRSEGTEPVIVNWAFAREIRVLAQVAEGMARGKPRDQLLKVYNVWYQRTALVTAALNRCNLTRWRDLLRHIAKVDRIIKGRETGDVWLEFESICLTICGVATVQYQRAS